MSTLKLKGEALYKKMRAEREQLVAKYTAGGKIRYDVAIGLRAPSTFTADGVEVLGAARTKTVPHYKEDGTILAGTRTVIDFDTVKAANKADGIASGTMMDALKKRAEGKIVRLEANDTAQAWGMVVLGEVECMLQLGGDIKNANLSTAPAFIADTAESIGLVHALRVSGGKYSPPTSGALLVSFPELAGLKDMKIESEMLTHRGQFKPQNYRGDAEWMKNPVSIWAITDKSRQSQNLFANNSLIRMWGENQVIDLNGFRISQHERPARVAAFHSLIDLSDGHFAGLSQKGARKCHIFSSNGVGILGRNNHFAIRGHFVKGLLVEGVQSGVPGTLSEGSYFGTAIFNDSSEIVFKDVHQTMVNKAVVNSSLGLSWYAALTNIESLLARYETPTTFVAANYPWLKWESRTDGLNPFGNAKQTPYPALKTASELQAALTALPAEDRAAYATRLSASLDAMMQAYWKSMKHADDAYVQGNTTHGDNFEALDAGNISSKATQIPRVVNLIANNPKNDEEVRYPDSVGYGFRAGSASEGVGKLAGERGGTIQDIYIMDSTFAGMHLSPMEIISLGIYGKGPSKGFNGMALRPFGYMNSLSPAASIAPALVLMSKEVIEEVAPATRLESKPVDEFDTAALAVANSPDKGWTAAKAHGLYKGNDILEAVLAALEVIGLLRKGFTAAGAQAVISGVDNSAVDIGILALRKSMMVALAAKTASQIGLKGGYNGDVFDVFQEGEIYPWFVSQSGSVSIDKDTELLQAGVRLDRSLSQGYLGTALPQISDEIFKLKLMSADQVQLVTADTETPVTYAQCAELLGFDKTSLGDIGATHVTYGLVRNLDGQNHVHKGAFGVRVDEASSVLVKGVKISDMETADAQKPVQGLGSHGTQVEFGVNYEDRPQSTALDITGVSLNGVTEAHVEDVLISASHAGGSLFGVRIAGKSVDVSVEGIEGDKLEASAGGQLAQPFGDQKVVVVAVEKGTRDVKVKKVRGEELVATRSDLTKIVEIESEEVELG